MGSYSSSQPSQTSPHPAKHPYIPILPASTWKILETLVAYLRLPHLTPNHGGKDGTNLEFHSNRISHRISSTFRIRIEYEYLVASNAIRILNGVEVFCRDVTSSGG